jgi:hypothetical protein
VVDDVVVGAPDRLDAGEAGVVDRRRQFADDPDLHALEALESGLNYPCPDSGGRATVP